MPRQRRVALPILVNEVPVAVGFELKLQNISTMSWREQVGGRHLIHAIGDAQGARVLEPVKRRGKLGKPCNEIIRVEDERG